MKYYDIIESKGVNAMLNLTKDNFKEEVEEYSGLVVIDIYADWCGPCKMLAPVLEQLAAEYTDVKFCKINVDRERELALMFNVSSIPLVALVKNNTYVDNSLGYVPKENLVKLIEEYK